MNGIILYDGPSLIDGKPIVAIATGLDFGGANSKTGPMVQIYILRSDVPPIEAVQTGDDVSICGLCIHRGKVVTDPETGRRRNTGRSCYVTVFHGPRVVYAAYKAGSYGAAPLTRARKLLTGKLVRLGSYGDPGAVPVTIWNTALIKASGVNGYTHLWREHPELAAWCMASCDTEEEREEAKRLGFRTFRVRRSSEPVLRGEGRCPASDEMSKAVQCNACMLCGGQSRPAKADITIIAHGPRAVHFAKEVA